jgi:tetratricopeptide (TPR) repeat protein
LETATKKGLSKGFHILTAKLFEFFAEIQYNMVMNERRRIFWLIFSVFLLLSAVYTIAQENTQSLYIRRFQNGAQLYGMSRWNEAIIEFRRAQEIAESDEDRWQALYWVILSELANSDFGSALRDMEELERIAPNSPFTRDMVYHRARVYYLQGFFEDALLLFNRFSRSIGDDDRISADRRAAAFFWMGECLYAMGQYDEAEKFYAWVIARYPESPKVEASAYRLDLITQKKIEAELLMLLQLSHEESLRTSEEHQRTIRTYEYTLNLFQRRIAELTNQISLLIGEDSETHITDSSDSQRSVTVPENLSTTQPPVLTLNESLLERARILGSSVEDILREAHVGGGGW